MSPPVLVAGEALVDVVVEPDGSVVDRVPGGSPLNVAVGLSRLEVPTKLLTWYAEDADGARITAHLAASDVSVAPGSSRAAATSVARAVLDADRQARYEIALTWDPPWVDPARFSAVHVGSLGTVVEPGATTVRALAGSAVEQGVPVSYDPNVRPALAGDPARAWEAVRHDAALATVVKLSEDDADFLRPDVAVDDVLDLLLEGAQTRLAVLTLGAGGARLAVPGARVDVTAPEVEVVDTVGAGDAFMAGLLAALYRSSRLVPGGQVAALCAGELRRLGEVAARVAALTCRRRGADPPRLDELDAAGAPLRTLRARPGLRAVVPPERTAAPRETDL
ncbi:MAG: carbohydrate kinase [Actinomycetota bacterium]|nr:carbohydrate kinase [Actinomycetota bacterium]